MNNVFLIGNLTRDPELNSTASGISVCNMCIAVNREYVNEDGEHETDFFNVKIWRERAENCAKFLKKGSKIAVTGSIQNRNYEDKDGNMRYTTEVVATKVEFLNYRKEENTVEGVTETKQEMSEVTEETPWDGEEVENKKKKGGKK